MSLIYLTFRGVICRVDSWEVAKHAMSTGWRRISRAQYYQMQRAIRSTLN